MNDIQARRLTVPVITGSPRPNAAVSKPSAETGTFQDILRQKLGENSGVAFSKHAASRVTERNIDLNANSMERLNEGVRLAEEKGLKEPLILVGSTAFIVSVANNTVITTVEGNDLRGNVFTNIDGTVII